jgi:hypothetical protein
LSSGKQLPAGCEFVTVDFLDTETSLLNVLLAFEYNLNIKGSPALIPLV